MSKKIPFLEMFSALRQWPELAAAVSGWNITEAAIDRAARSAVVTVEGAAGAGPNLIVQAEERTAQCYGLEHVKLNCLPPAGPETENPAVHGAEKPEPLREEPQTPQDAFARAEAIRAAALKQVRVASAGKKSGKKGGEEGQQRPDHLRPGHQARPRAHRRAGAGHGHGGGGGRRVRH